MRSRLRSTTRPLLPLALAASLWGCSGDDAAPNPGGGGTGAGGTGAGGTTSSGSGGSGASGGGADGGSAGQGGEGGAAVVPCTLTDSGPVDVTADGQVVERLRITADGGPAVRVEVHTGAIIRDVEILHAGGVGIQLSRAPGALIQNVSVTYTDAPASGPNPTADHVNISCYQSDGITVERARLTRGSSGIYLQECESWPEDNVNVYQSLSGTVRRGLIDGNNSQSCVGVIFDGNNGSGLVDVVEEDLSHRDPLRLELCWE